MNLNQNQARQVGIALLILGVVALFDLWGLLPVALLAGGGIAIYRRQRAAGRVNEAVQAALWGVGLALLLAVGALWPGLLLLGGASLLLRGREAQAEQRAGTILAQLGRRSAPGAPVASAPSQPAQMTIDSVEQPATNQTVRLR